MFKDISADYAISMCWFKRWDAFSNGVVNELPGPIDNSKLLNTTESKTLGMLNVDLTK